jgi:Spy/CpxP family protein refolding chaperone
MQGARKQAVQLLTGDTIDRAAIEAMRAEHLQLAEQASRRVAQALADTVEVLAPAQRKELAGRINRWHGHRG